MTKKRVQCPECGFSHTIQYGIKAKTIGVRAGPAARKGEFNYEITMPEPANGPVRFSTIGSDLLITCAIGIAGGGTLALIWAAIIGPYYPFHARQAAEVQAVLIGAGIGVTLAWGWLCAETNQRLKRVLPWFIEQRAAWDVGKAEASPEGVVLTVDHRHRDGRTQAGRTIQYLGVLPVDVERFNQWARAVLGSDKMPPKPLAQKFWVGLKKGNLFSRTEYEPLPAHLVSGGTVMNLPGNKGHVLTEPGRRAIKQHLKAATPPAAPEGHAYA